MTALPDPAFDMIDDRHGFAEIGIDTLPVRDSILRNSLPRWGDQATLFPRKDDIAAN